MKVKYIFHFGTIVLLLLTVVLACCSNGKESLAYVAAVLCGCLLGHLLIWIISAIAVVGIMNNRANDDSVWFKKRSWENRWYKLIGIRKWKHYLPTYNTSFYDFSSIPRIELLGRISQTEVVHEVAALLSIVSIVGTYWFGLFPVFLTVAIVDCLINIVYAMLQRYNRIRLRRVINN